MTKTKETPAVYGLPQLLTTVTKRGQTTIPHRLRQRYGVQEKTKLRWIDTGRGMLIVPVPDNSIKAARGMLSGRCTSTQIFLAAKEAEIQLERAGSITVKWIR